MYMLPHHTDGAATRGGRCAACTLRPSCLPEVLADGEVMRLEQAIVRRCRVARDDVLLRTGEPAGSLYAVRSGHFKCTQLNQRGVQHVTGFPLAGDVLGLDSFGTGMHASSAIALEDSAVGEISLARLRELLPRMPRLRRGAIAPDKGAIELTGRAALARGDYMPPEGGASPRTPVVTTRDWATGSETRRTSWQTF